MRKGLIIFLLMLLFLSITVNAISIGISPGRVTFAELMRDGYAERTVRVTTNSLDPIEAHFEPSGEVAPWLTFEPENRHFNISSGNPHVLKIMITPPNDTRSDSYTGEISFVTDRIVMPGGRAGSLIKAAVSLTLGATVTDQETTECRAGAFAIPDMEIGYPIELIYTVTNEGNVRIEPRVKMDIWDQSQENLVVSEDILSPEILPTVEDKISRLIYGNELDIGQYWASVSVDECGGSDLLSFSVVEKGGIVDKGVLEKVYNNPWAYIGEPVEIVATFRNSGPRIVTAMFQGNIKVDDEIVKVVETDEVDVESGESVELKSYFTAPRSGRYVVTGRVLYNKKLTFEKGSVINVNPRDVEENKPKMFLLIIYLIIIITILFILRKIIKAKKKDK